MYNIKLEKNLKTSTPNNSYNIVMLGNKSKCVLGSYNQETNKLMLDMWLLVHANKRGVNFSTSVLKIIKRITNVFANSESITVKF